MLAQETICRICGVSFNVRRRQPPWEAVGSQSQRTSRLHRQNLFAGRKRTREETANDAISVEEDLRAYSGVRILQEEMAWTSEVQCLIRKDSIPSFQDSEDDPAFQRSSRCFLTSPGRLSHTNPFIANSFEPDQAEFGACRLFTDDDNRAIVRSLPQSIMCLPFGVPFHPQCLQILSHVSHKTFGTFPLDALWALSASSTPPHHHLGFPLLRVHAHPALELCIEPDTDHWSHKLGTEFLAANPLITVPPLITILTHHYPELFPPSSSSNSSSPSPSPLSSPATPPPGTRLPTPPPAPPPAPAIYTSISPTPNPTDPFASLPLPLLTSFLSTHLPPSSLYSLRLASRAVASHPYSLPPPPWLWERDVIEETARQRREHQRSRSAESPPPAGEVGEEMLLDWKKLNQVLCGVLGRELNGLKNRKRIWECCCRIVEGMKVFAE
ncbi:MAG: hypothetical protein Q9227_003437 [Pyrenula ochraceoflavens]